MTTSKIRVTSFDFSCSVHKEQQFFPMHEKDTHEFQIPCDFSMRLYKDKLEGYGRITQKGPIPKWAIIFGTLQWSNQYLDIEHIYRHLMKDMFMMLLKIPYNQVWVVLDSLTLKNTFCFVALILSCKIHYHLYQSFKGPS